VEERCERGDGRRRRMYRGGISHGSIHSKHFEFEHQLLLKIELNKWQELSSD
jgi:hypothetical protein